MAFLFKKKSKNDDAGIYEYDEILGYFDEVIKQRKEIEIRVKKKIIHSALYDIDDKKKRLRIQDKDLDIYNGDLVRCGFSLDKTWFSFKSALLIINDKPYLKIPDEILHNERRQGKRVSFAQRENASASILESLGKGIGITGSIINISIGGISVSIDRAILIESEKEIKPQKNLIDSGKKLGLVRIKGIPGFAQLDTSGTVNEIRRGHKWQIAIELPKLKDEVKNNLVRFIESRSTQFTIIRRSRKKRMEAEKLRKATESQEKTQIDNKNPEVLTIEDLEKENRRQIQSEEKKLKQEENKKKLIKILIVGKELDRDLFFLRKFTNFEFFIANDIQGLIKTLAEENPEFLFVPHILNEQNVLNILIKLSQKELLVDIRVFLFIESMIDEKEVLKCKKLGVEGILTLPIKDQLVLFKKISKKK